MAQPRKGNRRQIQVVTAPATLVEILKLHSMRAGLPLGQTIADLLAIELEMESEVGAPQMLDFDAIDRSGIPATDDMTGWIQTRVTIPVLSEIDRRVRARGDRSRVPVVVDLLAKAVGRRDLRASRTQPRQLALTG